MSKITDGSRKLAGAVALAIFILSFIVLFFPGDYRFFPAVFLSLLIAMLSWIVIYLAFGGGAPKSAGTRPAQAVASSTNAAASATSEAMASSEDAEKSAAADEAARKSAEEEAARKSAEESAARKAAEEAAARKAAEEEAARKAAEEEAARKAAEETAAQEAAEEEAARKAAEKKAAESEIAAGSATEPSAKSEDYDGDGVLEGTNEGKRPSGLDAPRDGTADDLKQIKGVGPKLEAMLNSLGFWHFDQVANWTSDEVAWVDANLKGFKGRVSRDDWTGQAKVLASGGETEFSKRVEDGDVY